MVLALTFDLDVPRNCVLEANDDSAVAGVCTSADHSGSERSPNASRAERSG
jgi:hypothetical protein